MRQRYLLFFFALILSASCMPLSMSVAAIVPHAVPVPIEEPVAARSITIGIEVGQQAPGFTLLAPNGNTVSLASLQGQVTIINFWASWVAPSHTEMLTLQTLFDLYEEDGLSIIGIAFADNPAAAISLKWDLGITYPILMDDTQVSALYQIQSLPATYVIDKQGVIAQRYFGPIDSTILRKNIVPLLN